MLRGAFAARFFGHRFAPHLSLANLERGCEPRRRIRRPRVIVLNFVNQ
jgi:hypothetical protein